MRLPDFLNLILFFFSIRETTTAWKFKGNKCTDTLHCNNVGETKIWKWFPDSKLLSRTQKRRLHKLHQGGSLALFTDWNGYGGLRTSNWIHDQIVNINKYGTSDGVLLTQNTREGTGILTFCAVYTNMRVVTFKTRMSIDTPHPLRNISRFFFLRRGDECTHAKEKLKGIWLVGRLATPSRLVDLIIFQLIKIIIDHLSH